MTRSILRSKEGQTVRVCARIERYGRNSSTYLLTDIENAADKSPLTDHVWVNIGKWADGFRQGDRIEFTADIEPYLKGYLGDPLRAPIYAPSPEIDWTFSNIRAASVSEFGPVTRMMPDGTVKP